MRKMGAALVSWLVLSSSALAQEAPSDSVSAEPGSNLEVYLVTAGPGDLIYERFSHNALWIRDRDAGTDIAYNWGIFSFDQESFIKRLAQGRMLYAMYGSDMGAMLRQYQADDREVVAHRVNLTPSERLELQSLAQAMDTDANRDYLYNYYLDNCSTRVRDALDQVLGGQIEERWRGEMTGTSFRWHTRRLLRSVPWAYYGPLAYYGIQFVLGNPGGDEISSWEEMFLPLRLLQYLERTEVSHSDGTTTALLGPGEILYQSSRGPVPTEPKSALLISLITGLGVAGVLGLLAHFAAGGSRAAVWVFLLVGGGWALLTALLGTGLMLSWFLTDHTFWRLNENVFLTNPLGWISAFALWSGVRGRGWARAAKWTTIVAAAAGAGILLQALPGFDQESADIMILVIPGHFALAAGVLGISRRSGAESEEVTPA